ncbi:single-strand DNA-binding protein [Marisediminicola sp. UYEF4]|uniref:single-stranded DNA-binding protein n=1 Tax=Marisediminicola sp. UYEF4 TaxID=1756384 RepID=UPI003390A29B
MTTDTIIITGNVASAPNHYTSRDGVAITRFRLASNLGYFDKRLNKWVETETNFYSVSTYRKLAVNAYASLNSGDAVVLSGRLHIRPWQTADKAGTNIDIDVDWMGHDLTLGTARWTRSSAVAAHDQGPAAGEPAEAAHTWSEAAAPPDADQAQFGAGGTAQADFDSAESQTGLRVDDEASVPF